MSGDGEERVKSTMERSEIGGVSRDEPSAVTA